MATPGPIAGTVFVRVNGAQYLLRGSLTVSGVSPPGTGAAMAATGVAGMDQVHGFTEKPIVPKIGYKFSDTSSLSISQIQAMRNVTATVELANGKVYVAQQAWTEGEVKLNAEDGSIDGEFGAYSIYEQLGS